MSSSIENDALALEHRTIRKVRLRIIPVIFVLYIVAFLDRWNITVAALTMNNELGVTARQYGLVSGLFFIGYFVLEVPSNLVLHRVGARVWIARIMVTWGVVAMLGGLVRDVHELYLVRFFLGVAEAGFAPGMLLYLTYWFRQREQARAVGLYLTAIPVSGILGSPISGFILDRVHWMGLSSWRWLLILEGFPAIVLGIATYVALPCGPDDARFLTADEKHWLKTALAREAEGKSRKAHFSALQALTTGRAWRLVLVYFGMLMGLWGMTFYGPLLVKAFATGSSNTVIGLLSMIPALMGLAAMILIARNSDRTLERRYHVAVPAVVAAAALLSLSAAHSTLAIVGLLAVAAIGTYGFFGPFWALPSEFLTGVSAAAGLALINSFGNLAGFVSPFAIGAINARTGTYFGGLALAGACMFAAAILITRLPRLVNVQAATHRHSPNIATTIAKEK
jgi:ACS family tartrate transporter-like MFS transporter